jgi:hypothetical protein
MPRRRPKNTKASKRLLQQRSFSKRQMLLVAAVVAVIGTASIMYSLAYRSIGEGFGTFNAYCDFSHRSNDDPIVFPGQLTVPGQPGPAHSHDFFGATTLTGNSTTQSIQQGGTTCQRFTSTTVGNSADKSAYWVPTLYVDNQPVQATRLSAFYKADYRELKTIQPFPAGLQVIAGTASGGPMEAVPGKRIYFWECHVTATVAPGTATTAPTCQDYTQKDASLNLYIAFPECWNGVGLDSADHKSHMAYASQKTAQDPVRKCPASHPVPVPALTVIISYPTNGGPTTRLSSGDLSTSHADFMNGWDQATLTALVKDCLWIDNYCGGSDKPVPGHEGNELDPIPSSTSGSSSSKQTTQSPGSASTQSSAGLLSSTVSDSTATATQGYSSSAPYTPLGTDKRQKVSRPLSVRSMANTLKNRSAAGYFVAIVIMASVILVSVWSYRKGILGRLFHRVR